MHWHTQTQYLLNWYESGMELDDFIHSHTKCINVLWLWKNCMKCFQVCLTYYMYSKCWLRGVNYFSLLHTYILWAGGLIVEINELSWVWMWINDHIDDQLEIYNNALKWLAKHVLVWLIKVFNFLNGNWQ